MSQSKFESIINELVSHSSCGEIKEVYNDLLTITGENSKSTILDAIEQYNISNAVPVDLEGRFVIISKYNKEGSKFFDPKTSNLFSVDHLNLISLDIEKSENKLTDEQETIDKELLEYSQTDFPGDITYGVFSVPGEPNKTAILISCNRYNTANFWTGRWKSEYIYDNESKSLQGSIDVQVHYYEDGNVKFKSTEEFNESNVSSVVDKIKELEKNFERQLDNSFTDLNENQFKQLRRRLPVTRSKVNWGKAIGNYRLGKNAVEGN
ncbi:hypothetical protein Kpol_1056p38 [Vanderwaltozyma polyspora DSM 70294]|uniref:F-actin-capping protein subunit alpha n=1 Tax=Vanderwaltozyma polyspora (strain ATCC 22028 / DSM 70294 / BCRC 21397 / CBS 2163 / NBRC 10782 / NRRL Y-8283 / UCD 57-17) TaxID=436907 RepID=A7TLP5_VANPO|nr:uncharacterized protein Kpol_1056p38 [Vanderwaltozyma polyspora DSM 70294]EDO16837.1 hypothetical protein Kpol_1056p38 [Vanderwaltozyma polyspora DSM 70294]